MSLRPHQLAIVAILTIAPSTSAGQVPPQEQAEEAAPTPVLTAPTLLEGAELSMPEDTAPLPPDAAVVLLLTVDATGRVSEAVIAETLREDVDSLVVEAARSLVFSPATRDGVPIPARIRFRFAVRAPQPADEAPAPEVPADDGSVPEAPVEGPEPGEAAAGEEEPELGVRAVVRRPEPGAASRITLRGEELTTVPGTFGEPLRVVATLPGVTRTPFGLGYFLVRGASFENTGFLVDGFPVPILYHLGAGPAVLSSRLVEELDFYPGGYPARYGRFSGGIISLTTGAPPVNDLHAEAEIDLFRASALVVAPLSDGRGTLTAAYRRSYYELILPLIVDGIDLAYSDFQVRADYRLTDRLEGSLFWFGSDDTLDTTEAAGAGVSDDSTESGFGYGFSRLIGKLTLRLPDRARLTWSGTIGFDETLVRRSEPGGLDLRATIDGTYLGQRIEAFVPLSESLHTTLGIDVLATMYDARTTFPTPPGLGQFPKPLIDAQTSEITVEPVVLSAAPYIEQVVRLDPFELIGALRLEYSRYADVSRVDLDPRAVVRFSARDDLVLKAASGLFTQAPQPFQIDPFFGNPRLRPIRSWQSSAGAEIELPLSLEIEPQVFYSRMTQMARTTNDFVPDGSGGVRRQVYEDDGEGRSYGFELLVRRRATEGLYGWLSYTLSWSERFTEGGQTVPFFFDQRHMLNLALSYAFSGWRFGARLTVSTGRPDRPVLGAEYDADGDRFRAVRGGLTGRLPTYHQLDLRIDRDFTLGSSLRGSVYLDVLNAYNASNAEGRLYQFDFAKSIALPGLPILATIGLRLEYE